MSDAAELIEYLARIVPDATVECAGCGFRREVARAVRRDDQFFCSESCAARSCAVMIKPQPEGENLDGWDV